MIGWGDIYKVVVAMAPLYAALGLGYGSVKWWRIFTTSDQCEAINKLVAYFSLPFYTFQFTLNIDPFRLNYRFLPADAISKLIVLLAIAAWAKITCNIKGSSWCITMFSLSTLTNSLVVGVPLLTAMYGRWYQELVVQSSVVQALVWITLLLFVLELRKAKEEEAAAAVAVADVEINGAEAPPKAVQEVAPPRRHSYYWSLLVRVLIKLLLNPNAEASILGISWALLANRWHFGMPSIMEDSVLIMSRTGTGLAMFSMGLFMAQQEKIIACGPGLTLIGMILRFIAGPAAMLVGALAVGLHGDVLRVSVIQAALPQAIVSFVFAKEYGLHADVISTAVIFGMLVSLPVLVAYYMLLGFMS